MAYAYRLPLSKFVASHKGIFSSEGYTIKEYRYWDSVNQSLDIDGLLSDLKNAEENSVVVLHACAHNPTGMDLTEDQWLKVRDIVKVRFFLHALF